MVLRVQRNNQCGTRRKVPAVLCEIGHMNGRKEYNMGIHKLQAEAAQETEGAAAGKPESNRADRKKWKGALKLRRGALALALCCMLLAVSSAVPVLASPTPSASDTVIDSSLVGELVDLVKQVAGLFSVFPINVFLIGSLAGLGFTLFRKAKRTAVD